MKKFFQSLTVPDFVALLFGTVGVTACVHTLFNTDKYTRNSCYYDAQHYAYLKVLKEHKFGVTFWIVDAASAGSFMRDTDILKMYILKENLEKIKLKQLDCDAIPALIEGGKV